MPRISKSKQDEIRQNIIDVSRKLFFSKGFVKTSTREIVKQVGIGEGTLFNYFKDKNDLFLSVVTSEFDIDNQDAEFRYSKNETAPEIIFNYLVQLYNPVFDWSKSMISELSIALISLARKSPDSFKAMTEIDFKYIAKCKELLDELKENGLFIEETDTQELTENILSTFLFEIIIFVNGDTITHDEFMSRFKRKIESVCKGYLADGHD